MPVFHCLQTRVKSTRYDFNSSMWYISANRQSFLFPILHSLEILVIGTFPSVTFLSHWEKNIIRTYVDRTLINQILIYKDDIALFLSFDRLVCNLISRFGRKQSKIGDRWLTNMLPINGFSDYTPWFKRSIFLYQNAKYNTLWLITNIAKSHFSLKVSQYQKVSVNIHFLRGLLFLHQSMMAKEFIQYKPRCCSLPISSLSRLSIWTISDHLLERSLCLILNRCYDHDGG